MVELTGGADPSGHCPMIGAGILLHCIASSMARQIGNLLYLLPFADAKALAVYDIFERGAYRLVNAER